MPEGHRCASMLEKPDIPETLISLSVQRQYGLDVRQVTFLPLGYDKHTAVYQVRTEDEKRYFLKLRNGYFEPVTVSLPQFLVHQGARGIIAPLETLQRQLFGSLEGYTSILYPYIQGKDGYEVKLSDEQWVFLGKTLRMVHDAHIPPVLALQIPCEVYDPQWRDSTRDFLGQIEHTTYADPVARDLSVFMRANRDLIRHMVDRAAALAAELRQQPNANVLCHNDAHPGNYLVADSGDLYLVDWDNPILAPRERDLMCIGGGMAGDQPGGREERLFYLGYGPEAIRQPALAYYRYERVIQDIAEFCKQIFLTTTGGADRAQSYQYLVSSFAPASVVEAALHTDTVASSKM